MDIYRLAQLYDRLGADTDTTVEEETTAPEPAATTTTDESLLDTPAEAESTPDDSDAQERTADGHDQPGAARGETAGTVSTAVDHGSTSSSEQVTFEIDPVVVAVMDRHLGDVSATARGAFVEESVIAYLDTLLRREGAPQQPSVAVEVADPLASLLTDVFEDSIDNVVQESLARAVGGAGELTVSLPDGPCVSLVSAAAAGEPAFDGPADVVAAAIVQAVERASTSD